jgi:hypothetical protein
LYGLEIIRAVAFISIRYPPYPFPDAGPPNLSRAKNSKSSHSMPSTRPTHSQDFGKCGIDARIALQARASRFENHPPAVCSHSDGSVEQVSVFSLVRFFTYIENDLPEFIGQPKCDRLLCPATWHDSLELIRPLHPLRCKVLVRRCASSIDLDESRHAEPEKLQSLRWCQRSGSIPSSDISGHQGNR